MEKARVDRIHWLDVLKGILIVLMVMGHVPNIAIRQGYDIGLLKYYPYICAVYGCFFMQTFFVATGYTGNFSQPFKKFFVKQIKNIIIPYISFCCILKAVGILFYDESLFVTVYGQEFFFLVEGYWFLTSLFLAKILYWIICNISDNQYFRGGYCILLMLIGFAITLMYQGAEEPSHYNNYFHYRNGLCMMIFLWIGTFFRKLRNQHLLIAGIVFLICYITTFLINWLTDFPIQYLLPTGFSHGVDFHSYWQIPSYMFYAFTGSAMVILAARWINENRVLEYIGKNSIVFYCIHFSFLQLFIPIFEKYVGFSSLLSCIIFMILVTLSSLLASAGVTEVLRIKPFKYLLGRF